MVWESQWALALVGIPTFLIIFICEVFLLRHYIPKLIYYAISIFLTFFSIFMLLSCSASLSYIKNSRHKVARSDQTEHANYFMLLTISLNGAIWFLLVIFYIARVFMPSTNLRRCQTWLLRLVLLVVVVNAAGVNVFGVLAVDVSTVVVVKGDDSSPQTLSSTTAAVIADNSTSKTFLTTSAASVSSEPVTTAKSLTTLEKLRSDFCLLFSEYEALCKGDNPAEFYVETKPLAGNNISDVPVVVVATNRTTRLHRSLYHLLQADGANKSMITVVLDGEFPCQAAVAKLFGVKYQFNKLNSTGAYRITEHYRMTITKMFDMYPDAPYIILLEDDLQVSPDFYSFFSQTEYLMREDDSIFCISAWNDFGYKHSSKDTSAVFRVEGMPGLGWMLSRKLYKGELEVKWPNESEPLTWDGWLREGPQLQGRECLIPEVSRTYHFDPGIHVNAYQQKKHFNTRSSAQDHLIPLRNLDSLKKDAYEKVIHDLLKQAVPIRRNMSRCDYGLVPRDTGKIFVLFLNDDEKQYWTLARCFNLWEYDVRAGHQDLWRMTIRNNQYLVMRCPISPYCSYMPNDLTPMKFTTTNVRRALRLH